MALVLAIAAAACYGSADFLGGLSARRAAEVTVVVSSQSAGLVVALAAALLVPGTPLPADLLWGGAAGAGAAGGLLALYRGLARGRMAVVAGISAGVAALIPVLVGFLGGDPPSLPAGVGAAVALPAIVMIAWLASPNAEPATVQASEGGGQAAGGPGRWSGRAAGGVASALAAGCCFGAFYAFASRTSGDAGLWPLVAAKLSAVPLLAATAASGRRPLLARGVLLPVVAIGVLDVAAQGCYLLAAHHGPLPLVGLVTSTYPVATVVLAGVVLGERLDARLLGAIAATLVGVVLMGR